MKAPMAGVATAGVTPKVVGTFGSKGDGAVLFYSIWDITQIPGGDNLLVSDLVRVQVFRADGSFVRELAQVGKVNGRLHQPTAIACGENGELFIPEEKIHRVSVFQSDGTFLRCFGTEGNGPAQLHDPCGAACDRKGYSLSFDPSWQRS